MKSVDKKSNTCINSSNAIKVKDPPKCKICDFVRISKYKNIFAKVYVLNQSEEVFVIKKLKALYHGHMLLVIIMKKKLLEPFFEK